MEFSGATASNSAADVECLVTPEREPKIATAASTKLSVPQPPGESGRPLIEHGPLDDARFAPGHIFASRYRIVNLFGRGAMVRNCYQRSTRRLSELSMRVSRATRRGGHHRLLRSPHACPAAIRSVPQSPKVPCCHRRWSQRPAHEVRCILPRRGRCSAVCLSALWPLPLNRTSSMWRLRMYPNRLLSSPSAHERSWLELVLVLTKPIGTTHRGSTLGMRHHRRHLPRQRARRPVTMGQEFASSIARARRIWFRRTLFTSLPVRTHPLMFPGWRPSSSIRSDD
jgi:hypothetical protein